MLPLPVKDLDWVEQLYKEDDHTDAKIGVFAYLTTIPTFVLIVFLKHDILRCACPGAATFLDKVCIHQTDPEKKKAGISKIGAFLAISSRVLIIYSDVYLQKLWTVYEVACFLISKETTNCMDVLHVSAAPLFFVCLGVWYITMSLYFFAVPVLVTQFLVYGIGGLAYCIFCRHGHRDLDAAWRRVRSFHIGDATCYDETDRPLVERNIVAFLKSKGYVRVRTSGSDALRVFDDLVRTIVLQAMQLSLGTDPLPPRFIMTLIFLTSARYLDVVSGLVRRYGMRDKHVWLISMYYVSLCVSHIPLGVAGFSWLTSKCLHLRGWREWVWMSFCWLAPLCSGIAIVTLLGVRILLARAKTSNIFMYLFLLFHAVSLSTVGALLVWQGRQAKAQVLAADHHREEVRTNIGASLSTESTCQKDTNQPAACTLGGNYSPMAAWM